jgi:hypothetical protein
MMDHGWGRRSAWANNCGDQDLSLANRYRGEDEVVCRKEKGQLVKVHIGKADEAYRGSRTERSH